MTRRVIVAAICIALIIPVLSFAGEGADNEKQFIRNARQLTYEGPRAGEGYFSPDGNMLIFQAERESDNPFYQIYTLSFETGDITRVSPGHGKTTCAFFRPDNKRVIFASTHLDPATREKEQKEFEFRKEGKERRYSWDYDESFDIFSANLDGSDIVRLTDAQGYDAEGGYSPDGKQIVFCSTRDAYPIEKLSKEDQERIAIDVSYYGEIYIMNADGSNPKRLTNTPGYDGGSFFTPDGKRIVWRRFDEDGAIANVYTMKLDGSDKQQITDFGSMCWAPFYHPSGDYLIFTTNKLGFTNFELYIVDAEGKKEPVRVTYTDGFDGLPVFSYDGKRISWTSNRAGGEKGQIFIGGWNHAAALAAIEAAPMRGAASAEEGNDARSSRALRLPVAGYSEEEETAEPFSPAIRADDMHALVTYLASDLMEGRMTGSKGERLAGEYIASHFYGDGLEPMGDNGTWFQTFPFTSGIKPLPDDNKLEIRTEATPSDLEFDKDFRPLAFTENATVEGDVVFAGYGLTAPGDMKTGYNSYDGLDVKDKIVLVLRYFPEDVEQERRQQLVMYAGLRYKAMIARENGAKGLLVAIGPNTEGTAGELISIGFDQSLASSGIPVMSVSGDVVEQLFAGYDQPLTEIQEGLDMENPHVPGSFELPGVHVKMTTAVEREIGEGRNVIGYLPPGDNSTDAPVVVIGSHYDHIGHGETGSLARKGEEGMIHNGADDNASGTSVVIELAAAFAAERAKHPEKFPWGMVFATWSGEELGIIGSNYFVANPPIAEDRIAAYFNFDMVGRCRDNKLMIQGIGSSDVWKRMIEKRNVMAGFNLELNDDPFLPTDVTAFYPKGIPVMAFFTGVHEDYNRPTDDAETLDYDAMERIARMADGIITDLIASGERPKYAEVQRSTEDTGSRASLRAYLGTIPDYATGDMEGVKLSGVRAGGPADKGGLQGGDVIVKFAGKDIKNIYDYTYALGAIKIGEPVEVVVLRDGEQVTLTVVPEARK